MLRGYLIRLTPGLAGCACLLAGAASAGDSARVALDLKPGLWETTRTTTESGSPEYDVSHLTPEQQAALEALRQKYESAKPVTDVRQSCVTTDELSRDPFQDRAHPGTTCVRTTLRSTPTAQHVRIDCTGVRPRVGEMRLDAKSPEKLKGSYEVTSPGPDGKPGFKMTATWTSTWLGANCGDVK